MCNNFTMNDSFDNFVQPAKSGRRASYSSRLKDELGEVSGIDPPVGNGLL